jgi:hypothetical protein
VGEGEAVTQDPMARVFRGFGVAFIGSAGLSAFWAE